MYKFLQNSLQNSFRKLNELSSSTTELPSSINHSTNSHSFKSSSRDRTLSPPGPLRRAHSSRDILDSPNLRASLANIQSGRPSSPPLQRSQSSTTLREQGNMHPSSLPSHSIWRLDDVIKKKEEERGRKKKRSMGGMSSRSNTITLPSTVNLTQYLSDELEPLTDYVTDLSMSYKSIRSDDTHLTRTGLFCEFLVVY